MHPGILTLHRALVLALSCLIVACGGSGSDTPAATTPPPGPPPPPVVPTPAFSLATTRVFDQITMPTPLAMYNAPGDSSNWYMVERAGVVSRFPNDPAATDADVATMIDISARVDTQGEGGLLDIAFHPSYGVNNNFEVFFSYTRFAGGQFESVISRFRSLDNGATLDATMEDIILTIPQDFSNHNGGQIAFGPDGFLYAGWGDGGSGDDPNNRGQTTDSLLGTFTRIDVDGGNPYAIPGDNPFAANAANPCPQGFGGGDCPEIFAFGLRNPYRWNFDEQTGVLWAGDVGQGAWEEVDQIENGGNYGWKIREGAHCRPPTTTCATAGLTDPVAEYDHALGKSITGGFAYRGTALPELADMYLFGDFISGRVYVFPVSGQLGTPIIEILDTGLSIVAFAEDTAGELYLLDIGGEMHQIVDAP